MKEGLIDFLLDLYQSLKNQLDNKILSKIEFLIKKVNCRMRNREEIYM